MPADSSAPRWDSFDLQRRLHIALDVAYRAVSLLGHTGYFDPTHADEVVDPEKVISETGILLLAAERVVGSSNDLRRHIDSVAELVRPYAQGERVRARVCMEPALALDHALAHLCLTRLGYKDPDLDRLLVNTLECEAAASRERLPHRALEEVWLRRIGGFAASRHLRDVGALRASMPCIGLDALSATRDDVYAFTHALMYVTDFGSRVSRLPRTRRALFADAEAALARCLDDDDYDLAGEVLLTWPMLRSRWSPAAVFGFVVLASVEDAAGFLPSLALRLQRYRELDSESRSRYAIAAGYHTAYVMGLLCAVALSSGSLPLSRVPQRVTMCGASAQMLELLEGSDSRPHWREILNNLGAAQQDSLAGLFLTMTLRRAALSHDLSLLREALTRAARYGILSGAATRQAADYLRRGAILSEIGSRGEQQQR